MPKTEQDLRKEERIYSEVKKLNTIYKELPENKRKTVDKLIGNAAFMAVTLEDLQSVINIKGYIEEYQNGANQKGFKKSSEIEIYNTMIINYTSVIKQLTDLLPEDKENKL